MSDDPKTATEIRLSILEQDRVEDRQLARSIDKHLQNLTHTIVRIEERAIDYKATLDRAFALIENMDQRMRALETEAPITKLVRGWGIAAVIGTCAIVLAAKLTGAV